VREGRREWGRPGGRGNAGLCTDDMRRVARGGYAAGVGVGSLEHASPGGDDGVADGAFVARNRAGGVTVIPASSSSFEAQISGKFNVRGVGTHEVVTPA